MRRALARTVLGIAAALLAVLIPVTAASGRDSDVRLLPYMFIGPVPLEAGTYQTRPSFVPRTAFTVGRGWSGGEGSHTDWCVGKGLKRPGGIYGGYRVASICGYRTWLPFTTAVSRFKALETLTAGPAQPIQIGGFPGVSFHAVVHGKIAPTRGLPFRSIRPFRPYGVRPGDQQIFLNVRGKTLLLQVEIFSRTAGEAVVRRFLRTVQFAS